MVDWRKTIQGLGGAWYRKAEEPTKAMSSQGPALSPASGNKGKEKAVVGREKMDEREHDRLRRTDTMQSQSY